MEFYTTFEPIMLAIVALAAFITFTYQFIMFPDDRERPRKHDYMYDYEEDPLYEASRQSLDLDLAAEEAKDQLSQIKEDGSNPAKTPPYDI